MGLSGCMCWRACSLIYPACNTHAPHRHLWPLVIPYYSLPHKRHDFRKKVIEHKTCFNFLYSFYVKGSRDSSVGIAIRLATGCKVRGSIPVGSRLSAHIHTDSWGPPSLLYNEYRVFPGCKGGRGVVLITHPHLVPRFTKKSTAIPLLSLRACAAYNRMKPFT
jgi:hypothetical protein